MTDKLKYSAVIAQKELWKRFVYKPYGIILDFADLDGRVEIPTPEECSEGRINAISWFTPIENGAFFNGLYLSGICDVWKTEKSEELQNKAKYIARGLMLLSEVGDTAGFIARGVATDGKSHYAIGSQDQTGPWFYGLWKYIKCGIAPKEETDKIAERMIKVAKAIEENNWKIPCDGTNQFRGNLAHGNFREAARLLFILRIMHELTQEEYWIDEYYRRLNERPDGCHYTRLELCEKAMVWDVIEYNGLAAEHLWVIGQSQACLRELSRLEQEKSILKAFYSGLKSNALMAFPFIANYRYYDSNSPLIYEVDWKIMNELWRPQGTVQEAVDLAMEQFYFWEKYKCPRIKAEASFMREPLFAAWIVTLSGDDDLIDMSQELICDCTAWFDWSKLYTSLFFIVECIYGEILTWRQSNELYK